MDVREEPDGSLLLTYDSSVWTRWLSAGSVLMLGAAAYEYFTGARGEEHLIGLLVGATTLGLTALVLLEQTRFRVDPQSRLVEWDRRWGFRRRTGVTPFSEIRHVSVERPIDDTGIPSRRIVLHLANGEPLPVTISYKSDIRDEISKVADALRLKLGHRAPTTEDSVSMLVAQGRRIDAVKLLVEKGGLSLTEAKRRVDEVRQR